MEEGWSEHGDSPDSSGMSPEEEIIRLKSEVSSLIRHLAAYSVLLKDSDRKVTSYRDAAHFWQAKWDEAQRQNETRNQNR